MPTAAAGRAQRQRCLPRHLHKSPSALQPSILFPASLSVSLSLFFLPWKLTEGKARKLDLYFEGEKPIRNFWETKVRPKMTDDFYE